MTADDRLEQLRAEVAHAQQRRDLYRAKSYGMRPTSEVRMRELEQTLAQAKDRLRNAEPGTSVPPRGA